MNKFVEDKYLARCQNLEESLGISCVGCNKCNRYPKLNVKCRCPFCKTDFEADRSNCNYEQYRVHQNTLRQFLVCFKCPVCKNTFFRNSQEIKEGEGNGRKKNVCEDHN